MPKMGLGRPETQVYFAAVFAQLLVNRALRAEQRLLRADSASGRDQG